MTQADPVKSTWLVSVTVEVALFNGYQRLCPSILCRSQGNCASDGGARVIPRHRKLRSWSENRGAEAWQRLTSIPGIGPVTATARPQRPPSPSAREFEITPRNRSRILNLSPLVGGGDHFQPLTIRIFPSSRPTECMPEAVEIKPPHKKRKAQRSNSPPVDHSRTNSGCA
jgi:hypothetical protein